MSGQILGHIRSSSECLQVPTGTIQVFIINLENVSIDSTKVVDKFPEVLNSNWFIFKLRLVHLLSLKAVGCPPFIEPLVCQMCHLHVSYGT